MLNYLVASKTRRRLLRLLWVDGMKASVSELARMAHVSFRAAHKELNKMYAAHLAKRTVKGTATVFEANQDHEGAEALRSLLSQPSYNRFDDEPHVRSWLSTLGAPLPEEPTDRVPDVATVLAHGVKLARADASVARSLPVFVWKNRDKLDSKRARVVASQLGERHAVGFFLDLTGTLAGDRSLQEASASFRDLRRRSVQDFFVGQYSAMERQLADSRSPDTARNWQFRMNMTMDTFASTFRSFATDAI